MQKAFLITVLVFVMGLGLSAQVQDDFADGEFSSNPGWVGDVDSFQVQNQQLQSKGSGTGKSSLSTACSVLSNTEWRFFVRFNFSPSTSNFCRIYLVSDQADLKGSLNGYYIQLGGSTLNTDSISLYRQNGNVRTRIVAGRPGTVARTTNSVQLKVNRDASGNWQLYSDTSGGQAFILEGSVTDNSILSNSFLGIYCQYTSSNAKAFFLDDVYAGPPIVDVDPPKLDSVLVTGKNELLLRFSEVVEQSSAENPFNYVVNKGIGSALTAIRQAGNKEVLLSFAQSFPNGQSCLITADSIRDASNNLLLAETRSFLYYEAQAQDVLINELLPDPQPQQGLPDAEFVELYNKSGFNINLKGWILSDGSSTTTLGDYLLKKDSFLIICPTANAADFAQFGAVLGVSSFPSLNNTGDALVLKNAEALKIDSIRYDINWYGDDVKKDGGWSLERINPFHPCSGKLNWKASTNSSGGTAGSKNSVLNTSADVLAPSVVQTDVISSNLLRITLSEPVEPASVALANIQMNLGVSVLSRFTSAEKDTLFISLSPALQAGVTYQLSISGIKDCWGNALNNFQVNVKYDLPVEALPYDVLINEVLADEDPAIGLPDAEYVELYNRAGKAVSLTGWVLSDGNIKSTLTAFTLQADSFLIVCSSANQSKFQGLGRVIGVSSFPSLGNDGDQLFLFNEKGRLIHYMMYDAGFYKDNIKKNGGWSLELVDPNNPCGTNNWKASINTLGGTPGKVNSVKGNNPDVQKPEIIRAYCLDPTKVVLVFSEKMDSLNAMQPLRYIVKSHNQTHPDYIAFVNNDHSRVLISYTAPFQTGIIYTIEMDSLSDCSGNMLKQDKRQAQFAIAQQADSTDVVINELLFNPRSGGADFVELFNRSNKVLDLRNFFLGNTDEANAIQDFYEISQESILFFPGQHICLSTDVANVRQNYFTYFPNQMYQVKTLPSMPDDAGSLVLLDALGKRYDQFNYSDDFHYPLIDDKNGVSLERIDFNLPSQDKNNWASAAATAGYATPAYRNSQYRQWNEGSSHFYIQSETFSPDGDGLADQLDIEYNLGIGGYSCTIRVFDAQGRLQRELMKNELLGSKGVIRWDGLTDDGGLAAMGIYILQIELFSPKGEQRQYRKTCVLAHRL